MALLIQRSMAATVSLVLASLLLAACHDGTIGSGNGGDGDETPADAGTAPGPADGPLWANVHHDAGTASPLLTPNSLTVNVGINRAIVPDYPGDACGSIARYLVLDVQGPNGPLQHVDLDCQMGSNGWTYFNLPAGKYTATMQLFNEGVNARVAATPAVAAERLTIHNDQQQVVSARTVSPSGGYLVTDGSALGECSDYGASDAEEVPALPWGIYTVKIEGVTADGAVAYCVQRQLFATKGDSIIFQLLAAAGGC